LRQGIAGASRTLLGRRTKVRLSSISPDGSDSCLEVCAGNRSASAALRQASESFDSWSLLDRCRDVEASAIPMATASRTSEPDWSENDPWIDRFHAGSREVIEELYQTHFERVARSVGSVLDGADKETAIHEVFFRLLTSEQARRNYRGGSFGAWIATVARNQAIDLRRRRRLEEPLGSPGDLPEESQDRSTFQDRVDAKLMVRQFREDCLPAKWLRVFELRFIQQLDQSEAARVLKISRTTLIYQEYRVRKLLNGYFLRGG
jgi:RNA polymerase sigma-70 factor, ECF subfamily